jgi:hypothetical protein
MPDVKSERRGAYLLACLALLSAGVAFHVAYLINDCPLDLSGDEAHYWEWSRRLDLSYYSKGPLVAYIIAGSRALLGDWSQRVVGSEALAVRLPAVALGFLTGLGLYVLALAVTRRSGLALAAVALTFTVPLFAAGSMLMTIDAPLACAWVWTLVFIERAGRRDSTRAWLLAGLLIALGILAKYTMVLVAPVVGLWLLLEPSRRKHLKHATPYLAAVIGLAGLVPIVIWNARHGWVSFRHVAGQAGLGAAARPGVAGIAEYAGGQLAVTGVVWGIGMWWALVELWRMPGVAQEREAAPAVRLLLIAAGLPWLLFLLFSPFTKVQPNWPMMSVLPATILLVIWLARRLRGGSVAVRRSTRTLIAAGVLSGGGLGVVAHHTEWLAGLFGWLSRGAPPLHLTRPAAPWDLTPVAKYDPSARLRGWSQLGQAVGECLATERAAGRDPFLLADDYQVASEIAFYCPGEPDVYCAESALGGRLSQYDLWLNPRRDPQRFVGCPCIYVGALRPELTDAAPGREPPLPGLHAVRTVEYRLGGYPLRIWTVFAADQFKGFGSLSTTVDRKY